MALDFGGYELRKGDEVVLPCIVVDVRGKDLILQMLRPSDGVRNKVVASGPQTNLIRSWAEFERQATRALPTAVAGILLACLCLGSALVGCSNSRPQEKPPIAVPTSAWTLEPDDFAVQWIKE